MFLKHSETAIHLLKNSFSELEKIQVNQTKVNVLTNLIVHQIIKTQVSSSRLKNLPSKKKLSNFEPKKIQKLEKELNDLNQIRVNFVKDKRKFDEIHQKILHVKDRLSVEIRQAKGIRWRKKVDSLSTSKFDNPKKFFKRDIEYMF